MTTPQVLNSVEPSALRVVAALSLFGIVAIVFSMWRMGGGHGSYLAAKLLFPHSMLIAGALGSIGFVSGVLALVQYPVYGALVSRSASRGRAAVALFAVHSLAAATAVLTSNANFPAV